VQRVVQKFDRFEDVDRAEKDYYFSLTASDRLRIMCELTALHLVSVGETAPRLARVYRIIKLPQR
jgi:hypothetical protein